VLPYGGRNSNTYSNANTDDPAKDNKVISNGVIEEVKNSIEEEE